LSKKNPINKDEKSRQEVEAKRVEPDLESDAFSPEEQNKIIRMVVDDANEGMQSMSDWVEKKRKDLQHLNSERPSVIENLSVRGWQSDRNLGICAGICDIYQATLLATCFNPDSIHFRDTEKNDVDNRDNLTQFTKWGLGEQEADFFPEVDDFIQNRITLGFSVFKIYWEVWYDWVDKRIPIYTENKKRIKGYKIEAEQRRFERGVIRNVAELDDILLPDYGSDIQKLPFFIEVLHLSPADLEELSDRGRIINYEANKKKLVPNKLAAVNKIRHEDEKFLGQKSKVITTGVESEKKNSTIDIYEWYGYFKKNGKREKYRFWVSKDTEIFLSGKPLRKINRSGKIPYAGGPLRRRPGFLRGGSLTTLITPLVNALNNNYNQKSDFQYFQNCPFGYYDKNQDGLQQNMQEIEPMKLYGVDGNPGDKIFFPDISRSLAWSYQDTEFIMQMIERLTGAASYFLTSDAKNATATRDNIVEQKGEVKFGLWVKRTQKDISEAINMWIQLYQDWAPPNLAKRVLGEDGKQIIKNLSIDSIHGNYDAYMVPDITSGSKAYERQTYMWATQQAQQQSIWMSPQMNPRGNYLLWKETFKKMGIADPDFFMPPMPKERGDYDKQAEQHFAQLKQGDTPDPPSEHDPTIVDCLRTFIRFKETKYQELDEEYRPNFDAYLFKAQVNYQKFMRNVQMQQMINSIAASAVQNLESLGGASGAGQAIGARDASGQAPRPKVPGAGQLNIQPQQGAAGWNGQ